MSTRCTRLVCRALEKGTMDTTSRGQAQWIPEVRAFSLPQSGKEMIPYYLYSHRSGYVFRLQDIQAPQRVRSYRRSIVRYHRIRLCVAGWSKFRR